MEKPLKPSFLQSTKSYWLPPLIIFGVLLVVLGLMRMFSDFLPFIYTKF